MWKWIITSAIVMVLLAGSYLLFFSGDNNPTDRYLKFKEACAWGDADKSWGLLSADTQDKILTDIRTSYDSLLVTADEFFPSQAIDYRNNMHWNGINTNRDVWGAILATVLEHSGEVAVLSKDLKVVKCEENGDTAKLYLEKGDTKGDAQMVKENGQWKVDKPYIINIAETGWEVAFRRFMVTIQ